MHILYIPYHFIVETLKNAGTGRRSEKRSISSSDENVNGESRRINERQDNTTTSRIGKNYEIQMSQIRCELEMKSLWQEFNLLGTEMIVTKAGRLEE